MTNSFSKFDKLHENLKKRHYKTKKEFEKKQLGAVRWLAKRNLSLSDVYQSTAKLLTTGTLAGTMLLSGSVTPPGSLPSRLAQERGLRVRLASMDFHRQLVEELKSLMPDDIGKIKGGQENKICQILEKFFGFGVCANYDGNELNYAYGWMGYEQHLYRYPGDNLEQHDEERTAGIAPGLAAWGFWADNKDSFNQKKYLEEKYYVAVQTLYLPEWPSDYERLYEWYKYRKVVVVNPENGTAVVAIVGDAGPASWTGKQFGGSPELMKALDLHENYQKGKVLLLFVKDPEDKIPLGPIEGLPGPQLAKA